MPARFCYLQGFAYTEPRINPLGAALEIAAVS